MGARPSLVDWILMAVHKPSARIVLHDNTKQELEKAAQLVERRATSFEDAEQIKKALGLDESQR